MAQKRKGSGRCGDINTPHALAVTLKPYAASRHTLLHACEALDFGPLQAVSIHDLALSCAPNTLTLITTLSHLTWQEV